MAQSVCVIVSAVDRERLETIVADRNQRQKYVERVRIVLASADRGPALQVAQSIGVSGVLTAYCQTGGSMTSLAGPPVGWWRGPASNGWLIGKEACHHLPLPRGQAVYR